MSKLSELIQRLCPDGVEFRKLGETAEIYTGTQLNKNNMLSNGAYPVVNGGVQYSGYTDGFNESENTITISQGGASAGFVNWINCKFWMGAHCYAIHPKEDKIIKRFLYFVLKNKESDIMGSKQGAGIPGINGKVVRAIEIPVPPREVQEEIVRILDKFSKLQAELQAELQARKQQYEYYRDKLLTPSDGDIAQEVNSDATSLRGADDDASSLRGAKRRGNLEIHGHDGDCHVGPTALLAMTNIGDTPLLAMTGNDNSPGSSMTIERRSRGVIWKKMSEIGTFTRGNGLQKKDFTDSGVGCIHYGQIYTRYGSSATKTFTFCSAELAKKLKKAHYGDIVIATTSENVEDVCKAVVWLGKEEVAVSGHSCVFSHNQNPKFVGYFLQSRIFFDQKRKVVQGIKVIDIKMSDFEKILIPIPPLAEQERIVGILDRFEALTSDLQAGLPAEIQARRQQYEHYRDRLLTFPRRGRDSSLRSK